MSLVEMLSISKLYILCGFKVYAEEGTVCPRSSGPFYIVIYNIKWVTTSWTHSI